jgi:hypothetical protein
MAGRRAEGAVMAMCNGCLVVHRDGTVAYCSEEIDGGVCDGYEMAHLAGIMSCRVTPRRTRCRYCDDIMCKRLAAAPPFVPEEPYMAVN